MIVCIACCCAAAVLLLCCCCAAAVLCIAAVENVEGQVHNLIVCTLCSCYPISILGMSPHWYRGR
jgi:nitrile hydratase